MGSLEHWEKSFNAVGWFIPPYVQMGVLNQIAAQIAGAGASFSPDDLGRALSPLYDPVGLAAMVLERYPIVPIIKDCRETIAEAIEAHFFGLNHVAIGGLVPVIEGAGTKIATQRGLSAKGMKATFNALARACKEDARLGDLGEIESMMDSFTYFVEHYLYVDSGSYPLVDKTNRHGIAHEAYADSDYGGPLSFYKAIAGIDFLTFVAAFGLPISWFAPNPTERSLRLTAYYFELSRRSSARPK